MKKVLKIALRTLGIILLLVILVVIWLNTSSGQNFVRGKAEDFLRKKLKTEVYIGKLGWGLPKVVSLEEVLVKDQAKDTLLAVKKLKVNINMLALISGKVEVSKLELAGVNAHIYRNAPDTSFNFGYIIDAFAGKKTEKPEEVKAANDTSSLAFDVDKVELSDIRFRFDDYTGGSRFGLVLGKLDLKLKEFDPIKMKFHVKELEVAGLHATMVTDTSYLPEKPEDTTEAKPIRLAVDDLKLNDVSFSMDDVLGKSKMSYVVGKLEAKPKTIDLENQVINIEKLLLENTTAKIWMGKNSSVPQDAKEVTKEVADSLDKGSWKVRVANIDLAKINFAMDNDNEPRQKQGIDYAHLNVTDLALNASSIVFTGDTISGDIKHIALMEQCGLQLKELRTNFNYHPQGATLDKLYLETSETILQDHAEVSWPSMAAMQKDPNVMRVKVNFVKSVIGIHDLLVFVPSLNEQEMIRKNKNGKLKLEAVLDGFLSSLGIEKFYLSGLGKTEINLNGRINNVADANNLAYNLNIIKLQSSRDDIGAFIPKSSREQVRIPDWFGVTGKVVGTAKVYNTPGLTISTSDGSAFLNGGLNMATKGNEKYDMAVRTDKLNIGRILKKDSLLGMITLGVKAHGRGFDITTMTADVTGDVQSALVKGYNYNSIEFAANIMNKVGDLKLTSQDPNAHLGLNAHADLTGKYVAAVADLDIDSIDMQALNLSATELRTRGNIHIDAPELNPDYPNASLIWRNPLIVANGQRYATDSFSVISKPSVDSGQNIILDFDALYAKLTGRIPLTRIGDVIQEHVNRHYSTLSMMDSTMRADTAHLATTRPDTGMSAYGLRLTADIKDRPILHGILPGLEYLDTIHIEAGVDTRDLFVEASMPRVVFSGTTIENGLVDIREADSAINYNATFDKIEQGSLRFWYPKLGGNIRNKIITANVSIADSSKTERFAIGANMKQENDRQIIQLLTGLKLDYETWSVAQPNQIVFGKEGFYAQNFEISSNNQSLKINSEVPEFNTPLNVDINNFIIGNITQAFSKDTTLANGVLGGKIVLERMKPSPQVTGDLQIKDLSVLGDTVGNLALKANNKTENSVNVDMAITGRGNDIGLRGDYYLKPVGGNAFDFMLSLRALELKNFEGIAQNQIKNSSGQLTGELNIKGVPAAPVVSGDLKTRNLATTITMLNSYFLMPSETITFSGSSLDFKEFKIKDSAGNQAVIDGQIITKDFRNMRLDLGVNARNWRALHSTAKDNDLFYGDLFLTTKLNIRGTPSKPDIDGSLNILKGTEVTVVSPEKTPSLVESEGIVKFVNKNDSANYLAVEENTEDTTKFALAPGSNININLSIAPEAAFSFIIDKASGDFVNVKGDANLNANVENDGTVSLTGVYNIKDGAYLLNYNLIKRKFRIQDGSTITFTGEPLKADVNITAVYVANVPSYDLVERQVADPAQLNYYKQRLPFNIELLLKGQIMQPLITFNIDLPEDKVYRMAPDQLELVRSKINQIKLDTSELTKQVFAVLLLNRFVSDDPFSSDGGGGGLAFTAKQSVSRFLGEQLNKFASDLVKGVDLSIDLAQSEDYTTGARRERTDLSINASKSLLNDRLKVTIGNDFELQGAQSGNADQNTSYLPGNLAADYNLTTDGRYVVRAYRRAYDEGVLQGFVTETGLNFIVSMDYNKFKQLFRKRRTRQAEQKTTTEDTTAPKGVGMK
jgi:translocation and assembly module TamB